MRFAFRMSGQRKKSTIRFIIIATRTIMMRRFGSTEEFGALLAVIFVIAGANVTAPGFVAQVKSERMRQTRKERNWTA